MEIEDQTQDANEPVRYTIHDVRAKARNLVVEWQQKCAESNSVDYIAGLVLEQMVTDALISMCHVERREDG